MHTWTLDNFRQLFDEPVYRDVAVRTVSMAIYVTIADAVLAFPLAYYMARVASPRTRNILVVAVLTPLWASYLVKAYIWRTMLGEQGIINWLLSPFGLEIHGKSSFGLWLAFTYLWLPFMVLPIYAGLERISQLAPRGVGRSRRALASDVLEGDGSARVPGRSSRARSSRSRSRSATTSFPRSSPTEQFIGTVIYTDRGTNLPVAAAFAMVPVAVMTVYLFVAKRLGAFESL